MNPHFFTAPFYFAFIWFRVQGSGFRVQGSGVRWRLRRLFILISIPCRLYCFVRRSSFTEAFASIEPVEVQSLSFHSLGISGK